MTFPIDDGTLLTMEDVKDMSEAEINANWARVSECLAANRRQQDVDEVADDPPPAQQRTGWQPLTLAAIKLMTPEQINGRWDEVQRVLAASR
jgi:hypothetical protein